MSSNIERKLFALRGDWLRACTRRLCVGVLVISSNVRPERTSHQSRTRPGPTALSWRAQCIGRWDHVGQRGSELPGASRGLRTTAKRLHTRTPGCWLVLVVILRHRGSACRAYARECDAVYCKVLAAAGRRRLARMWPPIVTPMQARSPDCSC